MAIFDEIWPTTLYYIEQGFWQDFLTTIKICKKFNFDRNQLKLSEA